MGRHAPSAGKAGGLRWGSPAAVSRSRARPRHLFCGTRETGAGRRRSARLLVRRVRRDCKREKEKKGKKRTRRERRDALRTAPRPLASRGRAPARRPGRAARLAAHPPWAGVLPAGALRRTQHCPVFCSTAAVPCYAASNVEITYLGQGRRIAAVTPLERQRFLATAQLGCRPGAGGFGHQHPAMGFCGRLAPARPLQQQLETPHLERTL